MLLGLASGFFLFYAKNDDLVPLFNFKDLMAASLSEKATLQFIKVLEGLHVHQAWIQGHFINRNRSSVKIPIESDKGNHTVYKTATISSGLVRTHTEARLCIAAVRPPPCRELIRNM